VQKGQIAHIDGNNEHAQEDNLAFLCFDHHDELDGTTRLAKGLKENEVKHWRDELYREMEYRFRTVKNRGFELSIVAFRLDGRSDAFSAIIRLKNTGDVSARSPTVTIRLPDNVLGSIPPKSYGTGFVRTVMPITDPWAMREDRQDIFEPNGRVATRRMPGVTTVLMPGHFCEFDGLYLSLRNYQPGQTIEFEYRVDAEDMAPVLGTMSASIDSETFIEDDDE
jgi:hypothetical protein